MTSWLVSALGVFGVIGVIVSILVGLMLCFAPAVALRLGDKLNREWSFSWLHRALDTPRRTEPLIYRHHRIIGFMLVLATAYFFWSFVTVFSVDAVVTAYGGPLPDVVLEILAITLTSVLVIGNALGFALGIVLLVRPSALKGVERAANTWVDTDKASEVLNKRDDRPESMAQRHPRRVGLIILIAALYVLVVGLSTFR